MSKSNNTAQKYNWCLQVEKKFEFIGEKVVWNAEFIKNNKARLIKTYNNFLRAEDINSLSNSRSLQLFPDLTLREGPQNYLKLKLPLFFIKIFAQIRLINNYNTRIIFKSKVYKFDMKYCCGYRELKRRELYHLLIECDLHNIIRKMYISLSEEQSVIINTWLDLLNFPDENNVQAIVFYVKTALKID